MTQFTFEAVKKMTYAQLGAVEDPINLMSTARTSPMLVRYLVRTGQLDSRYPGVALPVLLDLLDKASALVKWQPEVGQKAPVGVQDAVVDAYLDELQPHVRSALKLN